MTSVTSKGARTRARMIEATAGLLQRHGFYGTGVNDVVRDSGAPKGSLYFHFPGGKEQLAAEALRFAAAQWRDALAAATLTAPTTADALDAALRYLGSELEASAFRDGCPVATAALDAAASSDAVREACADGYRIWTELITARLVADGRDRDEAAGLASFILAAIEGALLLARVYRSTAPLAEVARRCRALLDMSASTR